MASHQQQQLNHAITMRKCGLSPEETEQIVSSKVNQLLRPLLPNDNAQIMARFKERTENVMKSVSCSIKKDGYMDNRRCSPKLWQVLDIISAPTDPKKGLVGPQKFNDSYSGNYTAYLSDTKTESQKQLFFELRSDHKLNNNVIIGNDGYLRKANGNKFSNVELCNALDGAAMQFVEEFLASNTANTGLELEKSRKEQLKPMIKFCLTATISRIALTILHPDDIVNLNGHRRWKKHLELVASFATLTIALDLFGDQTCIPDNIVALDNKNF